jgi:hypothetical protein
MDILEALARQPKIDRYAHSDRIICEDGLLSVSDAVFEVTMRGLGMDKEDIAEWMEEPVHLRGDFLRQWGVE